jgi:DNA-nicking Smr family endonuclease
MAKRRPSKPAPVSAEDAALFRAAIGQVRELDAPPESPIAARPEPQARSREADDAAALKQMQRDPFAMALPGDAIEYLKPGLPPRVLRRLKRGHYKVQDEIDLHHMTTALAESALPYQVRPGRGPGPTSATPEPRNSARGRDCLRRGR